MTTTVQPRPRSSAATSDRATGDPGAAQRVRAGLVPTLRQFVRFGLVGVLNTAIDVLALNLLVWLLGLRTTPALMLANAAAFALGAVNSFVLNRRWTFGRRGRRTDREVGRFAATTVAGITLNDALLWLLSRALLPLLGPTTLWANASKVGAIGGSVLLSYLGMRLWVFAQRPALGAGAPRSATSTAPSPEQG